MTVARLIQKFSTHRKPVQVTDVRDQIVEWGYADKITIRRFDKNPENLWGNMTDYVNLAPYGSKECVVVNYNHHLSVPLQRLVCVKELIHVMDTAALRVSSKLQLQELIEQILHPDGDYSGLKAPALFEDYAVYQALAILAPEEWREELYDRYHKEPNSSIDEIAKAFDIPPEYAANLVSPSWEAFRARMLRDNEHSP